jgi:hypothetical protein
MRRRCRGERGRAIGRGRALRQRPGRRWRRQARRSLRNGRLCWSTSDRSRRRQPRWTCDPRCHREGRRLDRFLRRSSRRLARGLRADRRGGRCRERPIRLLLRELRDRRLGSRARRIRRSPRRIARRRQRRRHRPAIRGRGKLRGRRRSRGGADRQRAARRARAGRALQRRGGRQRRRNGRLDPVAAALRGRERVQHPVQIREERGDQVDIVARAAHTTFYHGGGARFNDRGRSGRVQVPRRTPACVASYRRRVA